MVEGHERVPWGEVQPRLRRPRRAHARASRFAYFPVTFFLFSICVALIIGINGGWHSGFRPDRALAMLLSPSPTPTVTEAPSPTDTPLPTETQAPAPPTEPPLPTPTLTPSVTATQPPPGRFTADPMLAGPDCSRTAIQGLVHDGLTPLNGVRVRVWWPEAPPDQLWSLPTGDNPALGPGWYEVMLDAKPRAGWWLVAVVAEDGTLLSGGTAVETTESGCEDGTGRQVVRVDFERTEGTLGEPGLPWTPTVPPSPTEAVPPTEAVQPTETVLPTATLTPSSTPTPLPTPDGAARVLKVPILMYHYISEPPPGSDRYRRDLSVSPDLFRAQLVTLREQGYTSITLSQLLYALQQGAPLPEKPIVLTFDDGYRDNYTNAFPIMKEEGFVGTFFVITDLVEERNNDYVTWEQLVEMRDAGMEIGSHTVNHEELPKLNATRVWQELVISRAMIEQRLGQEVHSIAYPYGKFDEEVAHLAREAGYWIAVTTKQGITHSTENLLTLRRVRVRGGMFPPTLMNRIHYWMVEARSEP